MLMRITAQTRRQQVNKDRRKEIARIVEMLNNMDLETIREAVESVRDEEQDYYDNMPEGFQNGDKGFAAEEAISMLDEVLYGVEEAAAAIGEWIGQLEDAAQ